MPISVFVVSCEGVESDEVRCLHSLIRQSSDACIEIAKNKEEADILLLVDVKQHAAYRNLRRCSEWRRSPERCFVYSELDNPPSLLHGVCASVPRWKSPGGRFSGFHFPLLGMRTPNPCPDHLDALDPSAKRYLLSFVGKASHRLRKQLFRQSYSEHCLIRRTDDRYDRYNEWSGMKSRSEEIFYWNTLAASCYALCPRGAGASSVRLFEAMSIGVAPIIVSDDWMPPVGPDWDEFAIVVPERSIRELERIALSHQMEWKQRGEAAKLAWERFFREDRFNTMLSLALHHVDSRQIVGERLIVQLAPVLTTIERFDQLLWAAKARLRASSLALLSLLPALPKRS